MARAARLFGLAALLAACSAPPAEAALRLAAPRALLQARNPNSNAAKAIPVFTVPPSAARAVQPGTAYHGGWFGTHLVVVLLFVGLVAFCTVYGADCMLFMFNRDGYERLKQEREEFEEETRRRQKELYEAEDTPLLPMLPEARYANKHSARRAGGRD